MAGSVFHSIGFAFLHAAQRSKPAAASKQTRTGEHNISGICKQKHNALRAAEFFGDQSRDHSNAAHQQAGWKIHHGNLAGNRKPAAINHGGNRKDQRQIDNIGADDIAHGEGGLFFCNCGNGRYQLRERCADCNDRNADNPLGHTDKTGKLAAVINKELCT